MYKKRRGNETLRIKWVKVWERDVQEQMWGGVVTLGPCGDPLL